MVHHALGAMLAGLLALGTTPPRPGAENAKAAEEQAVVALKKLKTHVKVDEQAPGKPVVRVFLWAGVVDDAALAHLRALPQLQVLELNGTRVTDAGLAHLRGLARLRELTLFRTPITGAGLAHIKGLAALEKLNLVGTPVSDT